jgi:hypothetical protein
MAPAPDQRVSPEPAAFDRLEQKGRAAFSAQAEVGAERCDEIGGDVGWDAGSRVSDGLARKKTFRWKVW